MSRLLEYGGIVEKGFRVDGRPVETSRKARRSNRGKVIEGVALHFNQVAFHDEQFQCICPSAFDVGLKYENPVQFWLGHDDSLRLKNCKLELHATETELNFRLHLDDSEIAGHAHDLVESKAYTEMSVGWHSGSSVMREVDGKPVKFILRAVLQEISLCPSGVVKKTHAQISELKNCRSLREDVESKKFSSDNSFVELQRALTRLENTNEL
jgi:HK97 family phage prohead protease